MKNVISKARRYSQVETSSISPLRFKKPLPSALSTLSSLSQPPPHSLPLVGVGIHQDKEALSPKYLINCPRYIISNGFILCFLFFSCYSCPLITTCGYFRGSIRNKKLALLGLPPSSSRTFMSRSLMRSTAVPFSSMPSTIDSLLAIPTPWCPDFPLAPFVSPEQ